MLQIKREMFILAYGCITKCNKLIISCLYHVIIHLKGSIHIVLKNALHFIANFVMHYELLT